MREKRIKIGKSRSQTLVDVFSFSQLSQTDNDEKLYKSELKLTN